MRALRGTANRRQHEVELAAYTAWWSGALSQWSGKKFPSISDMLGKKEKPRRQSPDELIANVRALKAWLEPKNP